MREAGTWAQAAPLNKPKQGKKVGFGASRVQGTPKPARGSAGPPVSHPKKGCPGTASSAQSRGKEQPPHHCSRSQPRAGLHPAGTGPGCPRALQSTPATFLEDIWCHQVVGTQGTDHSWPAGRHKDGVGRHRAEDTLPQPGQCLNPTRPISVLLQPHRGAPPLHCTR